VIIPAAQRGPALPKPDGGAIPVTAESPRRAFGHFKNVHKTFKRSGQAPLVAIDTVSFDLHVGQFISLLVPSGCGKTTFLRIAAGLIPKTSGIVEINSAEVERPQPDFGVVFQQPNLMPWRTVLKNVLFPTEIQGDADGRANQRAAELLSLVGLSGFEHSYPSQLSGGMQQRVALCRALVHQPKLLLMDEPFGALDELTRMEMQDLLLNVRDKTGATVMLVTHSISEAVYLSDKVAVFSPRPAKIADFIAIDLPYPRRPETRYAPEFTELEHRAGRALGITR
jgi:NitT/TauT family transport system ATP-binding protein